LSIKYEEFTGETLEKMQTPGCFLVAAKKDGKCNVMTIGWGLIGVFWRTPVFLVAVRHSRFTHEFIEDTGEFTVNVPGKDMDEKIAHCGRFSGREHDKFKECNLILHKGKKVTTPIIENCKIHYECKVLFKLELKPEEVPADVKKLFYGKPDYHTLYFGKILDAY
jgi:flavin reductase (DIM6/NTAB) family NADH-FMN oxidoreductase RutF